MNSQSYSDYLGTETGMYIPQLTPAFERAITIKWIANINPDDVATAKKRKALKRVYDRWLKPPKI